MNSSVLSGTLVAWEEYKRLPHSPLINDSNILYNAIARFVEQDIQNNIPDKDTIDIVDASVANFTSSISAEEEFLTREGIRQDLRILLTHSDLSPREKEYVTLALDDGDATDSDRAEKMGISEGTIWKMKNRIREKARRAKRRFLSRSK